MSKRKTTRKRRWKLSSPQSWPWWLSSSLALLVYGSFGGILAYAPDYSPAALRAAVVLTSAQVVVSGWGSQTKTWWSQVAYMNLWMLFLMGIGIRFWAAVVPGIWLWVPLVLGGYLFAFILPLVRPSLSEKLAREQITPQTKPGRGCLAFSGAMLPIAGLSGYWLYEFSKRAGLEELGHLLGGVLFLAPAIGGTQYFMHHLWPKRPWAKQAEAETQAAR